MGAPRIAARRSTEEAYGEGDRRGRHGRLDVSSLVERDAERWQPPPLRRRDPRGCGAGERERRARWRVGQPRPGHRPPADRAMALAARRATRARTHHAEGAGEGRRHPRAAPVSAARRARAAEPAGRRARRAVRGAPQGADRLSRSAPLARPGRSTGDEVESGVRGATAASWPDRKSTRLNSSHTVISYAVLCLKKK